MEGWVKLWRKSLDSGLLQNPELWTFWCWCLMKATHRHHKQIVGWQTVELKPGQFVFGRKKAAQDLCLTERKIRTCLKKLENLGNLTIYATNKYSVISIVNWESYQQNDQPSDQQNDQHVTSRRPASDHKQECKNGKNVDAEASSSNLAHVNNGIPYKDIIQAWNQAVQNNNAPFPVVKKVGENTQRQRHLKARWKEYPDIEQWKDLFDRVTKSNFLRDKQWFDFVWLVKSPDNFQKALEGKYDNRISKEQNNDGLLF